MSGCPFHALREGLPDLPARVRTLPVDARGYPVPWFVSWIDGAPDFRVIAPGKVAAAVHKNLCWVCGQPLKRVGAFVIGPMCALNRVSAEPPSHRDCAIFAARACPFLAIPSAKRRDANLPADHVPAPGIPILRNPGVALVWCCRGYRLAREGRGVLFQLGEPDECLWFREGRPATRAEAMEAIAAGLPELERVASQDGDVGLRMLAAMKARSMKHLPPEVPTARGR